MIKQVILMRTDIGMNTGKMCAQAAHASMLFILDATYHVPECKNYNDKELEWMFGKTDIKDWKYGGMTKIVLAVSSLMELNDVCFKAEEAGLKVFTVHDKILDKITCAAIGPDEDCKIDNVTGSLFLLRG